MRRNLAILMIILYPVCILLLAAGFLAFVLSILKVGVLEISCVVWWFLFAGLLLLFHAGRKILQKLELEFIFIAFLFVVFFFGVLSLLLL